MALRGPNPEDLRKIHAEINQLVNQRFLITGLAISLFGGVIAWLIPKEPPPLGSDIGGLRVTGVVLCVILLFCLYLVSYYCWRLLRTYTTYLIVTDASNWEIDWECFRDRNGKDGYREAQTMMFLVLNVAVTSFPFVLGGIYSLHFQPASGLVLLTVISLLLDMIVCFMGFAGLGDIEAKRRKAWEELKRT